MRPTGIERDTIHDLAYYEAVPYLLVMESVERQGEWLRRAEYPELPGCAAEAPSAVEALENLEHERRRVLRQLWDRDRKSTRLNSSHQIISYAVFCFKK